MFSLFSDTFSSRDNALTRLDPRAKLAVTIAVILAMLLANRVQLPFFVFVLSLISFALIRAPMTLVLLRMFVPLNVAGVVLIFKLFTVGDQEIFVVSFAGVKLTAYWAGLMDGALTGARVLGAVSAMMLMTFVTPSHEIFRALKWFRVPRELVEIGMLTYRYIYVFVDQAADVAVAQQTRLGYTGLRRSVRSASFLAGSIITRSLDQATSTHEAMTARCYNGKLPFGSMNKMRGVDVIFIGVALLVTVGSFVATERILP